MFDQIASLADRNLISSLISIESVYQNVNDELSLDTTFSDFLTAFNQSHSPFLSTIKNETDIHLPENLKSQMFSVLNELNFNKAIESDIEILLTKTFITNSNKNIGVGKSAENEFVIFIASNVAYKNLLVDEDGDIEFLIIPSDKKKTYNKRFYKEDGLDFSKIIGMFNGL